jgi:hypothetical protein
MANTGAKSGKPEGTGQTQDNPEIVRRQAQKAKRDRIAKMAQGGGNPYAKKKKR